MHHQRPEYSCGIGNVQLVGIDSSSLNGWLWGGAETITVAIEHAQFEGLRVRASVYTHLDDLDYFVDVMLSAPRHGIQA